MLDLTDVVFIISQVFAKTQKEKARVRGFPWQSFQSGAGRIGIKIPQPTRASCGIGCSVTLLVGVRGFEPPASSSRTKRATKLRYTPRIPDLDNSLDIIV
jgi:hypothetical protein